MTFFKLTDSLVSLIGHQELNNLKYKIHLTNWKKKKKNPKQRQITLEIFEYLGLARNPNQFSLVYFPVFLIKLNIATLFQLKDRDPKYFYKWKRIWNS